MLNPRGIMARIGKHGNHSWVSRDWKHVDCMATGCMFNRDKKCIVPSLYKVGADGRCEGFTAPPQKKVEGD